VCLAFGSDVSDTFKGWAQQSARALASMVRHTEKRKRAAVKEFADGPAEKRQDIDTAPAASSPRTEKSAELLAAEQRGDQMGVRVIQKILRGWQLPASGDKATLVTRWAEAHLAKTKDPSAESTAKAAGTPGDCSNAPSGESKANGAGASTSKTPRADTSIIQGNSEDDMISSLAQMLHMGKMRLGDVSIRCGCDT
jgi:hypothetical protein